MRRFTRNVFIAMVLLCAMACITTGATLSQSINYQGKITDSSGNPLSGTQSITFRFYETSSGVTALLTIPQTVQCTDGVFSTTLTCPPALFYGDARWLGITVGSDPEMTPRQEIRPVPYALSIRPGANILSFETNNALSVSNAGGGTALSLTTTSTGVHALDVTTSSSAGSTGVSVNTGGGNSDGIYISNTGSNSYGVNVSTTQFGSPGFYAATTGDSSQGLAVNTWGSNSPAVDVGGWGTGSSYGVKSYSANNYAIYADTGKADHKYAIYTPDYLYATGAMIESSDSNAHVIDVVATGISATGINVETSNTYSDGISVITTGPQSAGIKSHSYGDDNTCYGISAYSDHSSAIYAESQHSPAIYADTVRSDHQYGLMTPDIVRALNYETDSSDVAEYMPVNENVTPGTVMIIGEDGKLVESTMAYDIRVAGIVSTAPGVTLGANVTGNKGEEQIAVAGRVPCKVDATKAPIHAGDLLTTSDLPGHAMKAEPIEVGGRTFYPSGIVLGKAMGTLENGTGVIEVLVTLQ
jgi:hypothetical protein